MPTPCWLKHLCSIRALVPVSFFLSILSVFLSLFLYFWLIPWGAEAGCVTQGILTSFLLSLSHRRLQTTRFRSIKGPTNPIVNYGLWLIMMHQYRFITCNKCATLVSDTDNMIIGEAIHSGGKGYMRKSLYIPLFFCEWKLI